MLRGRRDSGKEIFLIAWSWRSFQSEGQRKERRALGLDCLEQQVLTMEFLMYKPEFVDGCVWFIQDTILIAGNWFKYSTSCSAVTPCTRHQKIPTWYEHEPRHETGDFSFLLLARMSQNTTLTSFEPDMSSTQTVFDILWLCLFTIFACTWTMQHLNVPEQREGRNAGWKGNIT